MCKEISPLEEVKNLQLYYEWDEINEINTNTTTPRDALNLTSVPSITINLPFITHLLFYFIISVKFYIKEFHIPHFNTHVYKFLIFTLW